MYTVKDANFVVDELVRIYLNEENWHEKKLSYLEAYRYHLHLLKTGNIIYFEEMNEILGYCEFWKINFEQFGRLVCHAPFSAFLEDVQTGNICWVANVWIRKDVRRSDVFDFLKKQFYFLNRDCEYFGGHALRKKTQPIKVFKKQNLKSRLFTEGVI